MLNELTRFLLNAPISFENHLKKSPCLLYRNSNSQLFEDLGVWGVVVVQKLLNSQERKGKDEPWSLIHVRLLDADDHQAGV